MRKAESGNHQASVTSVTLDSTFVKSILSDFLHWQFAFRS